VEAGQMGRIGKAILAIVLVFFLIILIAAIVSYEPSSDDNGNGNGTNPPTSKSWHTVTTFSGQGDKDTDSFTIKGDKWKITWTTTYDNEEYAGFYGFAYPEGETVMYATSFDGLSGDTTVHEGNDQYYLKIITANLDSWSVTIEDYY
jgi:hypothetical protein